MINAKKLFYIEGFMKVIKLLAGFFLYFVYLIFFKMFKPESNSSQEDTAFSKNPLLLEIGKSLIPLVSNLVDSIRALRRRSVKKFGFVFPLVRIVDNPALKSNEYCIRIYGKEKGKGTVFVKIPNSISVIIVHLSQIIRLHVSQLRSNSQKNF